MGHSAKSIFVRFEQICEISVTKWHSISEIQDLQFSRLRREGLARRPKGKSNYLLGVAYGEKSIKSFQIKQIM